MRQKLELSEHLRRRAAEEAERELGALVERVRVAEDDRDALMDEAESARRVAEEAGDEARAAVAEGKVLRRRAELAESRATEIATENTHLQARLESSQAAEIGWLEEREQLMRQLMAIKHRV